MRKRMKSTLKGSYTNTTYLVDSFWGIFNPQEPAPYNVDTLT